MSRTIYDPKAEKLLEADPEMHRLFLAAEVFNHKPYADAASHIELGRIGLAIQKKTRMGFTYAYGESPLELVDRALRLPHRAMQFAIQVVVGLSEEYLDKIVTSTGPKGRKITLTDLWSVLYVPYPWKRGELIDYILTNNPTPNQLASKKYQLYRECHRVPWF
jgi:hypothetical protein